MIKLGLFNLQIKNICYNYLRKGSDNMDKVYDLIIIGAGPAGLTASIYAKRAMLDFLFLEKWII